MTDNTDFILDREFEAPRALVWKAWTDPALLARWYGPGVETIIHKFDLRPGGVWLNEMKMGEKSDLSRMDFTDVTPEERLVWHHASTDPEWNVISNPMMLDWPRVLLTTVTFEAAGNITKVQLRWSPHEATEAELACFASMKDKFGGGWGMGYKIIDEILDELLG